MVEACAQLDVLYLMTKFDGTVLTMKPSAEIIRPSRFVCTF